MKVDVFIEVKYMNPNDVLHTRYHHIPSKITGLKLDEAIRLLKSHKKNLKTINLYNLTSRDMVSLMTILGIIEGMEVPEKMVSD
jgi:N-acetylmuramic acid 6-phosphate (MurNAc-6-P) etherase